jgi:ubiquinone biosynthesis protein Coq4
LIYFVVVLYIHSFSGETTGSFALQQMYEKMKQHPVGQLILHEKVTILCWELLTERFEWKRKSVIIPSVMYCALRLMLLCVCWCQPRVTTESIKMETLKSLPEHTFGKAYYLFMKSHGFSPNER